MSGNNYQTLIEKLDAFIRKYYVNNLIRGALHSVALLCAMWIAFVLLEHYVFSSSISSTSFRKTLFYSFMAIAALAMGGWVALPIVQYFRLGKVISHTQAAQIIGDHFGNVKDKLINVLQLKGQSDKESDALLMAAINQKTGELHPVPFKKAIDLRKNRKYLRFAVPPVFLFLVLLFSSNIIESSTNRIFLNDKEFEREALFAFVVKNPNEKVVQYTDYVLEVEIQEKGALPSEVFIDIDNYKYKLERISPTKFQHTFYKVPKDVDFRLSANGFTSRKYEIDVIEKPNLFDFEVKLDYPAYVGRKDEKLSNQGDLVIPMGTNIEWIFGAEHTDELALLFPGQLEKVAAKRFDSKGFSIEKRISADGQYKIFVSNKMLPNADSVTYTLTIIPDLYPSIEVEKMIDSTDKKIVYFVGEASDDYGIRNVNFHYTIEKGGKTIRQDKIPMPIQNGKQSTYDYIMDVRNFELKPGEKLSYYFQVWDNDGVQGSKSAKTPVMFYQMPTIEEIKEKEEKNDKAIKTDLEQALKEMEKLNQAIKKAKEGVLQKNELNWQDRREIEKLIEQQKQAEEKIQKAQENFQENMKNQEEFQKVDPELAEKQEMLEELFEQIMSDEMKDLFEKMEQMLDNLNKEEVLQQLEEMQMNDEKLKMELDRMINLFKKMEVEKEMMDAIQELDSLAKQQEELSEKTKENEDNPDSADQKKKQDELEKEQKEINDKFDKLQEKVDQAKEKNEELESPMDMDSEQMEQLEKEVQENMKDAQKQMQQKKNGKASKSQKNAAKKMEQMSKEMKEMMKMNQMEQMKEDVKAMRQLLENLVTMSFEQEELITDINNTIPNTPMYVKLVQKQHKLKDDFRHIEDSLEVLAKRVFQLQTFITEKVTDIKKSLNKSLETLEERQKRTAMVQQQYTMTYVNDLALMLSEAMNQMQQQMASQMAGQQMCEKPGGNEGDGQSGGMGDGKNGSKPGMGGLRQLQDQLNKQLDQMQEMMKNGKTPGSKQFAEMAAKQAAIRKALQDMKREKQQKGKGAGKELQDLIDQMDKVETDLVNKKLPNDLNKRKQDILTRLLENENAEREREYDNKRKAEQPEKTEPKMPPALEEYLKQRRGQVEMFKTVSPSLKPYYKNLVEEYFRALK